MKEWKVWLKQHQTNLLIMFALLQFLVILGWVYYRNNEEDSKTLLDDWMVAEESSIDDGDEKISESEEGEWMVDLKGQVVRPGVYQVERDMRVHDVIEMAGGLKEEANTAQINFAQHLEDQMVIYIPHQDEEAAEMKPIQSSSKDDQLINLNTADVMELQRLNGIGEKKALQIVQHRTVHGKFATIEDLMEVKGIGEKTFDSLKELITVSN